MTPAKKNILKKVFALSPPEKRRKVTGRIGAFWDLGGDHHTGIDRYIAVLAFKNTLIVSAVAGLAVLSFVLYLVHRLNVNFSTLRLSGFNDLATDIGFVGYYAYIHAQLMGYVVFLLAPFYICFFSSTLEKAMSICFGSMTF